MHLVRVDLTAPGIGLYLTPLDPQAVERGHQYRLADAASVLRRENLAVLINGAFFSADSGVFYRAGDWARGVQTVVADGKVSHVDPHSYMLWFDADLTPHTEFNKPPDEAKLRRARWGIGGGAVPLWKGKVREGAAGHEMDRRTAIAIDSGRRLLWLAVFENASASAAARVLAEHGAQDGFLLDGGHSTTMLLGAKAAGARSGTLLRGLRPVATFFGVKADPL
jgi:exopolysaccharide biosynthesis protein